jgi:hypothetical protein
MSGREISAKISQCLADFHQANLMVSANRIEHMDFNHIHEREQETIRVGKSDERLKESRTQVCRIRTTHDPRPQRAVRNLEIVCHLGDAVGGIFSDIFVYVEVQASLGHRSFTIGG